MALKDLTAGISASASIDAELYENLVLRSTQQVAQVLQAGDVNLVSTQQVAQVLQAGDVNLRSTLQVVQVLYVADVAETLNLTAGITATCSVAAAIINPKLRASVSSTGTVTAVVTGIRQFNATVNCTAAVSANLGVKVKLDSTITADGDITTASLRKNIEYLDADITATGDITLANMFVPWHAGSTLELTQNVSAAIVKNESVQHDLDLQQNVDLIFGQRFLSASNTLVFSHSATVIRVLPVKTASSTLNLTHSAAVYREAINYLNLQHSVTGTIFYLEAAATSVLNLTHAASAEVVINTTPANQLNLTHLVDWDQITSKSVLSNLYLSQHAFAVVLASKKYVLLQAPFNLIQTSVVLPNPLLDDNESLVSNLMLRRSMTNVPYTYVQTSKNRRLRYTFILNRMKALELEAFFDSYNGADIKMLNWKGEIWRVKLITNPVDFVQTRRAEPGGDGTDVNLEFEGVLLNG